MYHLPQTEEASLSKAQIAAARIAFVIAGMFAGAAIAHYIVGVTTDAGFRLGMVVGAFAGFLIGMLSFPIKKS